jgi:hypothetical protein
MDILKKPSPYSNYVSFRVLGADESNARWASRWLDSPPNSKHGCVSVGGENRRVVQCNLHDLDVDQFDTHKSSNPFRKNSWYQDVFDFSDNSWFSYGLNLDVPQLDLATMGENRGSLRDSVVQLINGLVSSIVGRVCVLGDDQEYFHIRSIFDEISHLLKCVVMLAMPEVVQQFMDDFRRAIQRLRLTPYQRRIVVELGQNLIDENNRSVSEYVDFRRLLLNELRDSFHCSTGRETNKALKEYIKKPIMRNVYYALLIEMCSDEHEPVLPETWHDRILSVEMPSRAVQLLRHPTGRVLDSLFHSLETIGERDGHRGISGGPPCWRIPDISRCLVLGTTLYDVVESSHELKLIYQLLRWRCSRFGTLTKLAKESVVTEVESLCLKIFTSPDLTSIWIRLLADTMPVINLK